MILDSLACCVFSIRGDDKICESNALPYFFVVFAGFIKSLSIGDLGFGSSGFFWLFWAPFYDDGLVEIFLSFGCC